MRSYTVEGIVLKRINFGEADRIVTLFTRDQGKVPLLAKGVRKITSKRVSSLEPFSLISAQVIVGRGGLDILAEVKLVKSDYLWQKYLGRLTLAYQLCEVVDKLTPDHQPHSKIFEILKSALSNIGKLENDWQKQIKVWLLEILVELGFWASDKSFTGDIVQYIETLTERPINSHKLLDRLK